MKTLTKSKNLFVPRATGLGGAVRQAVVTLLLITLTPTPSWADQSGDWIYSPNVTGTECYIDGYTGSKAVETLTIPSVLNHAKVKGISGINFSEFTALKTLKFEAGCEIVTMPSVQNCSTLSNIMSGTSDYTLPSSITAIPRNCFRGTAVTTLAMSDVTAVGDYAFQGCSLTFVDLQKSADIGNNAFANISTTCIIQYHGPMSNWNGYKIRYSPKIIINGYGDTSWFFGWCGGVDESSHNDLVWSSANRDMTITCFTDKWTTYQDKQIITSHIWTENPAFSPEIDGQPRDDEDLDE